ncbi:MAG: LicD family protein [Clostridia bacterium]|nr:LicD family protein [Clostridia bacterium]
MTELQQAEFEMLKAAVTLCDRHEIPYFLVCGTALGAVKYGGFIPWDDDVDIGLFRPDYERFCDVAAKELPKPYFLQTYQTDPHYPNIFAKIRNSRTTYIEKATSGIDMNQGVYIDIFPLDGYPADAGESARLEKQKKRYKLQLFSAYEISKTASLPVQLLFRLEKLIGVPKRTAAILQKYEALIASYPTDQADTICNHGNWQGTKEYAPRAQYGAGADAMFEGLRVRVPEQYDEYLTQKYGDWRADLPKDQQVGHHYYEICDLDRPYTDYYERLPGGGVRRITPTA